MNKKELDKIIGERFVYSSGNEKKCGKITGYSLHIEPADNKDSCYIINSKDAVAIGEDEIKPYRGICLANDLGI